jgi:hypothetical protein
MKMKRIIVKMMIPNLRKRTTMMMMEVIMGRKDYQKKE